jgi:hypothetical protein
VADRVEGDGDGHGGTRRLRQFTCRSLAGGKNEESKISSGFGFAFLNL